MHRRKNATMLERRVEWLLWNHNLWFAWPYDRDCQKCITASAVCPFLDRMMRYCAAGMKDANLYAPSTNYFDIKFDRLVRLARERMLN